MGLLLCATGFAAAFLCGRASAAAGLAAVLTTGYLYGILRANFLDSFAHFIFDAAVVGFYLARWSAAATQAADPRSEALRRWLQVLLGWAVVMFLLPMQPLLIQVVGLRGNAFLVPFLLIGAMLKDREVQRLCVWVALLNLMALSFGVAEYVRGVPAFFPENPVTDIIYRSKDVAGFTAYRIPACFANAHSYAGTMVMTVPWLVGAWARPGRPGWERYLLVAGLGAALAGVFMAAARVAIVQLVPLLVVVTLSGQLRGGSWVIWVLLLGGIGYLVSGEERMQRFMSLQKTEEVIERIEGSINVSFWDLLTLYPMGNGLGGGGTSVPFFLQHLIQNPVMMENEYSRILLEQGLVGLILWLAFLAWAFTRRAPRPNDPGLLGWRLLWYACLGNCALSLLGTGLMTAIPQTALIFLGMGYLTVRGTPADVPHRAKPRPRRRQAPAHAAAVT